MKPTEPLFTRKITSLDIRDEELELDDNEIRTIGEKFGFGDIRIPVVWDEGSITTVRIRGSSMECPGLSEQPQLLYKEVEFFESSGVLVPVPRDDPEKEVIIRAAELFRLADEKTARVHHEMQACLADVGRILRFGVWVPLADREAVLALSSERSDLLQRLPDFTFSPIVNGIARLVDVVFVPFEPNQRPALFEVESTTTVSSGLLRMHDIFLFRRDCEATVVSHHSRRGKFAREIARPTFQDLRTRTKFMTYEDVREWKARVRKQLA